MKKILVVDDNKDIRQIISFILKQLGYNCILKESSLSALNGFIKNCYDLVFIDFTLPKTNGIELAKKIKKIDKKCQIILMTGFLREYSRDLKTSGIKEILFKPFGINEIREITEKYLKKEHLKK